MKNYIVGLLVFLTSFTSAFGQGTVRGKIADENGETLIGVTVVLKSNRSIGTTTDLDGNYSLKIEEAGPQTLIISYISYQTIEEDVSPVNNEIIIKNFTMVSSSKEIKEVTIEGKAIRAKEYYVESLKRNSTTTIDYVSSETMRKTGDPNVVAAVSRVSGVSTNGGFITVRGIGDRYVKTAINGSIIPTLDPFTNNIKLDLFPASLVDNIIITKTASADLPGDWAGAYISVETKDYPEQLAVNVETSVGYNSQSTFKDVLTSQRSKTDWLGYDNGFRDYDHNDFVHTVITPSQYQEFVALGLGPYYNSLGVNQQNWGEGTSTGENYYRLGLVQLGLLAPAQFNDPVAVANAKQEYLEGTYRSDAFKVINAQVPASGQAFADNWNTIKRKAPLDFSQSFSMGNQLKMFGQPLGLIGGFRYGSSLVYDPVSASNRAAVASDNEGNLVRTVSSRLAQEVSRESNGWSGLINASYKLNPSNAITLLFMPNFFGTNNVRNAVDDREPAANVITKSQFYEQRRQLVYQFKSEHYLPASKIKIETNASFADGNSQAPDFKNVQYLKDVISGNYQIGGSIGDGIHRYYRYLSDEIFDSRLSVEIPLNKNPGIVRKIKIGGAYQHESKESDQYDYFVTLGPFNNIQMTNDNVDEVLDLKNFDIRTAVDNNGYTYSTIDAYYNELGSPANHTFGRSHVIAGFIMADYTLTPLLRLSGGLRIEKAEIFTDVFQYDSLNLPRDDPRRNYSNGYPSANPGELDELSFLPNINLIYKLRSDDNQPINLRLNFSQSVARPSMRELSDVAAYDYEFRSFVFGNSDLKMVNINNYDLRLESYFKSGNNISISFFYKDFKNHIELVKSVGYSWQNVDRSHVAGIELEGKKQLGRHLEFRANVTLVKSETEFVRTRMEIDGGVKKFIPQDTINRPMFGQSPYVLNGILTYKADSLGLTVGLSYNVQGSRLVVAADVKEVPDIYELPRHLLDCKVSKTLGKHFSISLTVRDILNSPIRRSYNYDEGWLLDYERYSFNTTYVVGVSYKL